MKLNRSMTLPTLLTHEGGNATRTSTYDELRRSVLTCMMWENSFYEKGSSIAKRIAKLMPQVAPEKVAALAVQARSEMQLRHVPLFLVSELSKVKGQGQLVERTLDAVIQRPDELTEFLAIYWKNGKHPIAAAAKRGLASAFTKFNEYSLAKYNQDGIVKLRDVLFLSHAKPKDSEQAELWKRLVNKQLATPDTWETQLSAGADKRETFERLLREKKLGGLATLRNLRNMQQAGVDETLIRERLAAGCERALPFRFIAAAKHAPKFEDAIEQAMLVAIRQQPQLKGRTLLVVDTSGSMRGMLSSKSELSRLDAACGLSILIREVCEVPTIYATAGDDRLRKHATSVIAPRHGFALSEAVQNNGLGGGGIFFTQCLEAIEASEPKPFDRVIVFTDEQDCDRGGKPASAAPKLAPHNYVVNISVEQNGVSYRNGWNHIDGWSERVIDYIQEFEKEA